MTDTLAGLTTTEERERIKDFWLGLGEQERRNLVKIDRDAALKKLKELQKPSCSCAVCGRKRNAIEEELEVLYDAYYEELEQYAKYQQCYVSSGGAIPPPPGPGPFPGSVELYMDGAVVSLSTNHERIQDNYNQPEEGEWDDKEIPHPRPSHYGPGNILTVANEFLKNKGQKFLDMMEHLAEPRMQREEDAAVDVKDESEDESERGGSDIDNDDSEDGGSDEEDEEEDEQEIMTEEQQIEQGRRIFSIFAARMIEQRVLQAYQEKVAQEHRKQLFHQLQEDQTTPDHEMEQFQNQNDWEQQKPEKQEEKTQGSADEAQRSTEKAAEESAKKAQQQAFTARNMEPPVRPGRDSPSSSGILTNAHVDTINGGTFINVAHIYESDSLPAQGGGPAFPIAVLGLQAASFATRSHYPHSDHLYNSLPLLIPEPMTSTSSLVLHLPSLYQDMRTVVGPVATIWLLLKMLIRWRRSIEHP